MIAARWISALVALLIGSIVLPACTSSVAVGQKRDELLSILDGADQEARICTPLSLPFTTPRFQKWETPISTHTYVYSIMLACMYGNAKCMR